MKGKPLLPALRIKKRYVVYEAISDKNINIRDVSKKIIFSYERCFGRFGLADAGIIDTKIYRKNRGIIKINHKYVDNLRTAMAMITNINKNKVTIRTVTVSGILKKAKAKL